MRVWDSHSGQQFSWLLEGIASYAVIFSPNGQRIATGSADGTARIYPLSPSIPKLINDTWESFWYVFTPRQREALLLYLFGIDKDRWQNLSHPDKPEFSSQKRLNYLWNTIWQSLTSEVKEKLSIYLLRLVWQEVLWKKETTAQFKQLSNCLNPNWQNRSPQFFHRSVLFTLEEKWSTFDIKQQENIIKSLTPNREVLNMFLCPAKKYQDQ